MSPRTMLGFVVGLIFVYFSANYFYGSNIDKKLLQTADEMNKNCPMMIDHDTQLDNTIAGPGKLLTYNYTLVNYTGAELDLVGMEKNMTTYLITYVKNHKEMKSLRKAGVIFKYIYKDKNGIFLFEITVGPNEYSSGTVEKSI